MNTIISLRNVTRDYKIDEKTVITPVHQVSLDVDGGEFIIIIGRSGSGKTTLLNLAAGLIRPTSGEVFISDIDLWSLGDKRLSLLRNRKIGFVFQFPSLLPSLSSLQNVALPAFLGSKNGRRDAYARAAQSLETMGLSERLRSFPRQLSSGEQKRVVIARALINQPEILLADEPTSDLDQQTESEIMSLLLEINKTGVTIVMVTHGLELIPLATRTLKMENGLLREYCRNTDGAPTQSLFPV